MSHQEEVKPRGLFYEDIEIGNCYTTPRRTVTHSDIVNFSGVSGDFSAPHVDFEFCKKQPYGEPIAQGVLVFAIATGLQCQSGINDRTVVAFLSVDNWRMHAPVRHGDTIYMNSVPIQKRLTSKAGKGIVTFAREIKNHRGEIVQSMTSSSMYLCRPR
ncbi:MaoC/PaaZ C-terminal domain-containing protein [Variovorax sp. WDL1]|nr:MaoC/PaaZ C-terminal domain-containing protein [Variovorax sp. WDL1]